MTTLAALLGLFRKCTGRLQDMPAGARPGPRGRGAYLSVAANLARLGRYDEAQPWLVEAAKEPSLRPSALDLQARIFAQQGRYLEAERCWLEAVRLEPRNPSFRKALDALTKQRRPLLWLRPLVAAAALALASAAIGYLACAVQESGTQQSRLEHQVEAIQQRMQRQHEDVLHELDVMKTRWVRPEPRQPVPQDRRQSPREPLGRAPLPDDVPHWG